MTINKYPDSNINDDLVKNTAFGELRTSEPTAKIQIDFPYNINPRFVTDLSGGGGSLVQTSGMAVVSTSATTNASGVMESRKFLKYNPGQGGLARFTAVFSSGVAGSTQQAGIGDDLDGFFFGYNETEFGILKRRDGADEWVSQSDWNIDKRPDLDPTLGNVYQISYQWLGFGQVSFFIERPETGAFVPIHKIQYTNANLEPSILNPTLPMHLFVANTTNNTDIIAKTSSMVGFIDGLDSDIGILNASGVNKDVGVTEVPLISYRNNILFQSIRNRAIVELLEAFTSNTSTQPVEFRFVLNPVLTGANFQEIDSATSVISTDIEASAITGGTQIVVGLTGSDESNIFDVRGFDFEIRPGEVVTITGRRLAGGSAQTEAGLIWKERF